VGLIFGWAPQEILRPLCRIMLRIAAQEPRKIKAAALLRVYWGERAPDFEVISRERKTTGPCDSCHLFNPDKLDVSGS
jgi:hypothetical protein